MTIPRGDEMLVLDEMMKILFSYPGGTFLRIEWDSKGLTLEGVIDLKYESDNCLEEDNPEYREYYAMTIMITNISKKPNWFQKNVGDFLEISIENQPSKIELINGTVIWNN